MNQKGNPHASVHQEASAPAHVPIAIVGMSCLFPQSTDVDGFWQLICTGKDAITEVPETHWSPDDYFDPDPKRPDFTYCKRGGFLSPTSFDPTAFGIPPNVLEATDTSQLLSLIVAKKLLQDSGYTDDSSYDKQRVGVVIGVTGTQELVVTLGSRLGHPIWRKALQEAGISPEKTDEVVERIGDGYVSWQENSFPGLLGNVVAGRIASRLDFGGTNCVVDAACASSLSAMHLSILELASGRADMMITGGSDTLNDIFMYMCFSKTPALSPTGDVRPFSSDADGTVLGEGLGMVMLKRLEDAERDGDRIYAVIQGMGTSSDGRSKSIYAPLAGGQARALRRAYEQADVEPSDITLLEAHGTGTKVGDATEFEGLRSLYNEHSDEKAWCAIGSVKSQIGHTKAAAGAASMIKAALALHHKVLPPTAKIADPNPKMQIEDSAFYLNTSMRPWISGGKPRRAGVSSFGFGGSNFHVVLEEAHARKTHVQWAGAPFLLCAYGSTKQELVRTLDTFEETLLSAHEWQVRQASLESCKTFEPSAEYRLIITTPEHSSLEGQLKKARSFLDTHTEGTLFKGQIAYAIGRVDTPPKLAALFPGQGSQYIGMGRECACAFPEAFDVLEDAEAAYEAQDSLTDRIFPKHVYASTELQPLREALAHTATAQPAIGAISLGLWKILCAFGFAPEAAIGHSYGELVALCASGRITEEELHSMSNRRGQLMAQGDADRGTMLAVSAPLEAIDAWLEGSDVDVVLANRNAPRQGVLSGSKEAIAQAEEACKKQGWKATRLPVSAAFHSSLVEDARAPFATYLEEIDFLPGHFPVWANTTAQKYPQDASEARALLAQQLTSPVRFVEQIEALYAEGVRTFVEVGPKTVLSSLTQRILGERPHQCLKIDASKGRKNGLCDLGYMLAQLAVLGYPVSLEKWGDTVTVPEKQKMSVPLVGANYRSPVKKKNYGTQTAQPKTASVSVRQKQPASNPSVPSQHSIQQPATQPNQPVFTRAVGAHTGQTAHPVRAAWPSNDGRRIMSGYSNGEPKAGSLPYMGTPQAPNGAAPQAAPVAQQAFLQGALQVVQEGLRSMQALQQQTAYNHQQFLAGQQQAQVALREMLQSSQRLFDASLGSPTAALAPVQLAPLPAPAPVHVAPVEPVAYPTQTMTFGAPTQYTPAPPMPVAPAPVAFSAPTQVLHQNAVLPTAPAPAAVPASAPVAPVAPASVKSVDNWGSFQAPVAPVEPAPAAPVATPAPDSASPASLTETMLEVVSELTGYPEDMLSLDMDMEADLGIDSIKRVEILSAITERLPQLASEHTDHLGSLRTLQEIVDALLEEQGNGAAGEGTASVPFDRKEAVASAPALRRRLLSLASVSSTHDQPVALPAGSTIGVTDEGTSLTSAVVEILQAKGLKTLLLPCLTASEKAWEDIGTGRESSLNRALSHVSGVLILAPLTEAKPLWDLAEHTGQQRAFALAKQTFETLESMASKQGAFFATVTRMDGAFGLRKPEDIAPIQGGLAGLVKTFARESTHVSCRAMDVSACRNDWQVMAESIVDCCLHTGSVEVGLLVDGHVSIEMYDAEPLSGAVELNPGDVAVITGGARGVTASVAHAIAAKYQPTMILLGRSPMPEAEEDWLKACTTEPQIKKALMQQAVQKGEKASPKSIGSACARILKNREIRGNLERMRQTGSIVRYISVDARDSEAMQGVLGTVRAEFGPIRMLVHAAGVIEDKRIAEKKLESFEHVFATKIQGLHTLLTALGDDPLRYLILFSSVSGRTGNVGQVDYAMANEVLNKVAQQQAALRPDCHSMSLNWGPWDGGMVSPALKRMFEKKGVQLISIEAGAASVLAEMQSENRAAVEVVLGSAFEDQKAPPPVPTSKSVSSSAHTPHPAVVASAKSMASSVELSKQRTLQLEEQGLTLQYKRSVHLETHAVLQDHRLGGRAVVPVALMLEWLGHAALHGNPGLELHGYDEVRVLKGIALETDAPEAELQFWTGKAKKNKDTKLFYVPIEVWGISNGKELVHFRATALLGMKKPAASDAPTLAEDLASSSYETSMEDMYNDVLFHGPQLQGIVEISGHSKQGMTARIADTAQPDSWMKVPARRRWLHAPLAVDSAFQMAIVWCQEYHGKRSLPSFVGAFRQFRPFPNGDLLIHLVVDSVSPHKMTGCFFFMDTSARLIAQIDGYECTMNTSLESAFRAS